MSADAMGPLPRGAALPRRVGMAVAAAAAVYAWWATGLWPFTAIAYMAVGLPVVALTVVAIVRRPVRPGAGAGADSSPLPTEYRRVTLRVAFPWVVLFGLAAALEIVGLALGGRSAGVPTLSTVVDHALTRHATRWVLFCTWLAIGWVPVALRAVGSRPGVG